MNTKNITSTIVVYDIFINITWYSNTGSRPKVLLDTLDLSIFILSLSPVTNIVK